METSLGRASVRLFLSSQRRRRALRGGRPLRWPDAVASARGVGGVGGRPRDEAEGELSALYGLPIDLVRQTAAGWRRSPPRSSAATRRWRRSPRCCSAFPTRPASPRARRRAAPTNWRRSSRPADCSRIGNSTKHPRAGRQAQSRLVRRQARRIRRAPPSRRSARIVRDPRDFAWPHRRRRRSSRRRPKRASRAADGWRGCRAELRALIEGLIYTLDPTPLNEGEQQVLDQIRAAADPPKTFDELQQPPTDNLLGYQRHHSVEQNPDNVAKSLPSRRSTSSVARPSTIPAISSGFRRSSTNRSPAITIRWRTKTYPESSTATSSTSLISSASATLASRRCVCLECCNEPGRLCRDDDGYGCCRCSPAAPSNSGWVASSACISAGSLPDPYLLAMDKEQRRRLARNSWRSAPPC